MIVATDPGFGQIEHASVNVSEIFGTETKDFPGQSPGVLFDIPEAHAIGNVQGYRHIVTLREVLPGKVVRGAECQVSVHRYFDSAIVELVPEQLPPEQRVANDFDPVLFHRILSDGVSEVVAKGCRTSAAVPLGLRFPASYFPAAARDAGTRTSLPVVRDADEPDAPLVFVDDAGSLDMSHEVLRGTDEAITAVLRTLGMRSPLAILIFVDATL